VAVPCFFVRWIDSPARVTGALAVKNSITVARVEKMKDGYG